MYKNVSFAYPWMHPTDNVDKFNDLVAKSNKPTDAAIARWKSDIEAVNKNDDVICPHREDNSIASDIDTMITTNNPVLQNIIFGGMHAQPTNDQSPDLTDEQRIAQLVPRNSSIADLQRMAVDSAQSLDLSASAQAAAQAAAAQAVPDKPAAQAAAQAASPANTVTP